MNYYWKKKTIVSFILALLVILIHTSVADQYVIQLPDDNGKALAIFAGHLWGDMLARVAVPLFFILSGATFFHNYKAGMYKEKLRSRLKSLLIPYLIWNIISMCFYIFCSYTPLYHFFIGRQRFIITFSNLIDAILFYKCNFVFWFIYNLIVFVILTPVFDFLTSKKWLAYIAVLISLLLPLFASPLFSFLKMDASYVVFYMIGCMIGKYYFDSFILPSSKKDRIAGLAVCLLCMVLQIMNIYEILLLPSTAYQILLIIFCIAFWKAVDQIIEHTKVKSYMHYSFFIYALHADILACFVKIIYLLGPKKIWMVYPNFVLSYCATVIVILAITALLERKCNKIYSVLSGGR